MNSMLKAITLTDFRSIRGTITVPLDAPIVLVHGQNGAGKTSLLSGIELALTSSVPSLQRVDPDYIQHLVHKDVKTSRVHLITSGLDTGRDESDIRVTSKGVEGAPLLTPDNARFYSERCFLAQSSLGRLLELYQDKDTRKSDSPLTRFVKDLLGLDHLDSVIDGLYDAGDVRRFRSAVPLYGETKENIPVVEKQITQLRSQLKTLDDGVAALLALNQERLASLSNNLPTILPDSSNSSGGNGDVEELELRRLTTIRREISIVAQQWNEIEKGQPAEVRATAESSSAAANEALQKWRKTTGVELERVLQRLVPMFPSLPPISSSGPAPAHAAALTAIRAELERCGSILDKDAQDEKNEEQLVQDVARAKARSEALENQISGLAEEAGQLAEVLSGILPHVHTDDCPVCGRDFTQVSETPLQAYISSRIAALTESAGLLQALTRERTSTLTALTTAERNLGVIRGRRLEQKNRDELRTRQALLQETQNSLASVGPAVAAGQLLLSASASASRALSDLSALDQRGNAIRESANRFAKDLGLNPLASSESLQNALTRFETHVANVVNGLTTRQSIRREIAATDTEAVVTGRNRQTIFDELQSCEARLHRLNVAKDRADALIKDARELSKRAGDTRSYIVRSVFNDSLNKIWRDLFVRLAPEEPFVPAFAVPEINGGPVEAVLETLYRSGGKGGNPRAMLSAGNLNTAALTLFFALHLSVAPTLPWLVIDDPVQSMDEVHIAQFAALLRTLAKTSLKRQIIIAVHEKPLFDYLALELSPAFQNDRLITIELSRNADGRTLMNYQPHVWQPDTAIAA